MSDELGRVNIGDYVGNRNERLFHVGRLDADTEGLLILTNDGDLAHRLQHPQYGVAKTYLAQVPGPIPRTSAGGSARDRGYLDDGPAAVDSFKVRWTLRLARRWSRWSSTRGASTSSGGSSPQWATRSSPSCAPVGPIRLGDTKPGKDAPPDQGRGRATSTRLQGSEASLAALAGALGAGL